MITNIVLAFGVAVGVIISLLWPSESDLWRTYNCWFFGILLIYFISVMYLVFLRELIPQIAKED